MVVTVIRVVRLRGGLGNQLFQFAAAVGLGWPQPIAVDNREAIIWGNPLFDVLCPGSVRPATQWELVRLWQLPRVPLGQRTVLSLQARLDSALDNRRAWDEPGGTPSASEIPNRSLLLRGYFQDEAYFDHVRRSVRMAIRVDGRSPLPANSPPSVAVSLRRRADYALRGLRLDWSYFVRACGARQLRRAVN